MPKPLQDFYTFAVYQSREDFEAKTGQKAEPFDPRRRVKLWRDPSPKHTLSFIGLGYLALYTAIDRTFNNFPKEDAGGHPIVGDMAIPIEEAKQYNFQPPFGRFEPGQRTMQWYPPLTLPEGARVGWSLDATPQLVVYLPCETIDKPTGLEPHAATVDLSVVIAKLDEMLVGIKLLLTAR